MSQTEQTKETLKTSTKIDIKAEMNQKRYIEREKTRRVCKIKDKG